MRLGSLLVFAGDRHWMRRELLLGIEATTKSGILFQCPHGLELLPFRWLVASRIRLFQCPLGLIPHFYAEEIGDVENVIAGCQCPLGLIPHFYINVGVIFCRGQALDVFSLEIRPVIRRLLLNLLLFL